MLTESCPAKWSEVVHSYSPHHQQQFITDNDTVSSSHTVDDDDKDGAGSSNGKEPAARARYGRRYDPPDTVVIVERPSVTERTHSTRRRLYSAVTSGCGSRTKQQTLSLFVGVHTAVQLLTFDWTTAYLYLSSAVSPLLCLLRVRISCS